jgi:hypothetical protein
MANLVGDLSLNLHCKVKRGGTYSKSPTLLRQRALTELHEVNNEIAPKDVDVKKIMLT